MVTRLYSLWRQKKDFKYIMNVGSMMSQILGLIATFMLLFSYVVKSKKSFLILNFIGDVAYGLTFIFVNSLGAGLISFLSCVQNFTFYIFEKKGGEPPRIIGFIFIVLFFVVGIANYNVIYDIVPMLCYTYITIVLYCKKVESIKAMYILPNALLVFYDIMVMAYANAFEDGIEVTFLTVSTVLQLIKFQKSKGSKKTATLKTTLMHECIGDYTFQSSVQRNITGDNHILSYLKKLKDLVLVNPVNRYG